MFALYLQSSSERHSAPFLLCFLRSCSINLTYICVFPLRRKPRGQHFFFSVKSSCLCLRPRDTFFAEAQFPAALLSVDLSVQTSLAMHFFLGLLAFLSELHFLLCMPLTTLCVCVFVLRIRRTMNVSGGAPGEELTDEEKEIINSVLARAAMMENMEQQRIE